MKLGELELWGTSPKHEMNIWKPKNRLGENRTMRKIIVFNLVTVDGLFAGPNGEIDWHNYDDEMGTYSVEQLKSLGALIFGKTTYELMANYWPTPDGVKGEPVVAEIMNSILKIVFSKTLQEVKD